MITCSWRTRRAWFALVAVFALAALTTSGCADRNDDVDSLSATYGLPSTRVDVEAEQWVLVPGRSSIRVPGATPVTLGVDGNGISGAGPCNEYHGTFDLDGDSVEIRKLASTLRACEPTVMDAEADYFAALNAVDQVDASDDELVLSNDDGVRLVFHPSDDG